MNENLAYNEAKKHIGKKVKKRSKEGCNPRPFKSRLRINTIKGVIEHPFFHAPAFTFEEDDSYVAVGWCVVLD